MPVKTITYQETEIIMLDNGACVPVEQILALGLDPATVSAQEYKNKVGNAMNYEMYRIIEIHGKRACMVKTAFRNALANISNKKTCKKISKLDQEIQMLQKSIAETERNIAIAKAELQTELEKNEVKNTPLTTYVKTVLYEPTLQTELLAYYKEKIEELEQIKQTIKKRNDKKVCSNTRKAPLKKYKLYFHPLQKKQIIQDTKCTNYNAQVEAIPFSEEETAYRNQVYQIVNQFLDVSYGDEQGRNQFYNLISSCTNGYIAVEESTKTK